MTSFLLGTSSPAVSQYLGKDEPVSPLFTEEPDVFQFAPLCMHTAVEDKF
jgi:hypothetical protein